MNHVPHYAQRIQSMDIDEVREELEIAIKLVREYPTGQSDGTWIQRRQWFLKHYIPEKEIS